MTLLAQIIGSMALIYLGTLFVAGMVWARICRENDIPVKTTSKVVNNEP